MPLNISKKFDPVNCNYTTWYPDTCGCVITYEWDKSTHNNPELREHRPVHEDVILIDNDGEPVVHNIKCDNHKHHENIEEHYLAVVEESQRRQMILEYAAEKYPDKMKINALVSGQGGMLKADSVMRSHEFEYEGKSPNRILNLRIHANLTDKERQEIETYMPGKIKCIRSETKASGVVVWKSDKDGNLTFSIHP